MERKTRTWAPDSSCARQSNRDGDATGCEVSPHQHLTAAVNTWMQRYQIEGGRREEARWMEENKTQWRDVEGRERRRRRRGKYTGGGEGWW